jgi:hypothetical protein
MPGDPGVSVVTNARVYYHTTRGWVHGHPAFPTPSLKGGNFWQHSGVSRREIAKSRLLTLESPLESPLLSLLDGIACLLL